MYRVLVSRDSIGMADEMSGKPLKIELTLTKLGTHDLLSTVVNSQFLSWASDTVYSVYLDRSPLARIAEISNFGTIEIMLNVPVSLEAFADSKSNLRLYFSTSFWNADSPK